MMVQSARAQLEDWKKVRVAVQGTSYFLEGNMLNFISESQSNCRLLMAKAETKHSLQCSGCSLVLVHSHTPFLSSSCNHCLGTCCCAVLSHTHTMGKVRRHHGGSPGPTSLLRLGHPTPHCSGLHPEGSQGRLHNLSVQELFCSDESFMRWIMAHFHLCRLSC